MLEKKPGVAGLAIYRLLAKTQQAAPLALKSIHKMVDRFGAPISEEKARAILEYVASTTSLGV